MIKLCGMRREEDIAYANEFLPDFVGYILAEGFWRRVDIDFAARISRNLDSRIKKVGVFVDTPVDTVKRAAESIGLDVIQLHGSEDRAYIKALGHDTDLWKAVRVQSAEDIYRAEELGCKYLLLDRFVKGQAGGTGKLCNIDVIKNAEIHLPYFLAGGINESNLADMLTVSQNIDISGGTETDGVKDRKKIKRIMEIYNERKL